MRLRAQPPGYNSLQIGLHWLVVLLVAAQYASSGAIVRAHRVHLIGQRPSASDLILHALHNRVGLAIVGLMLGRLALRLWLGAPAPRPSRLTRGVHLAFYAVLIAQGVTGAIAAYFWWPISAVHVLLFKLLLALVAAHVAGALWGEFGLRDGTLRRMLVAPAGPLRSIFSRPPR